LTVEDWEAVDYLAQKKYNSWDWTYGRTPEFGVHHRIKLDSGDVNAHLVVNNGVIKAVELVDPLPESVSAHELTNKLIGVRFDL
jgi:lipoate-protein ligase A